MSKKKTNSNLEYKTRISWYYDKPLYIRIKERYPEKTESEVMAMFFEYKREESYYFKDMILLRESYEMIGKVLEHEKQRKNAFLAKMISFLFFCFDWFLLFKIKKEAEDIREKYLKITVEEWSKIIKETFCALCNHWWLSDFIEPVFQFANIQDSELQKMYWADTSISDFVRWFSNIWLEMNKRTYLLREKLPPPKYITKKYWL